MDGYDVEVLSKVSEDLHCVKCLKLMRNAMQLTCGHAMCHGCFEKLREEATKSRRELVCPSGCAEVIQVNKVLEVPLINRMILALPVKCTHHIKGCQWTGELGNLQVHLPKCSRLASLCRLGCGAMILPYMEELHLKQCDNRVVTCEFEICGCETKVMFKDYNDHMNESRDYHTLALLKKHIILKDGKKNRVYALLKGKIHAAQLRLDSMPRSIEKELEKKIVDYVDVIRQDFEIALTECENQVSKAIIDFNGKVLKQAKITEYDLEKLQLECNVGQIKRKMENVFDVKRYTREISSCVDNKAEQMECIKNDLSISFVETFADSSEKQSKFYKEFFTMHLTLVEKLKEVTKKIEAKSQHYTVSLEKKVSCVEESVKKRFGVLEKQISVNTSYKTCFERMVKKFENTSKLYLWKGHLNRDSVLGFIPQFSNFSRDCVSFYVVSMTGSSQLSFQKKKPEDRHQGHDTYESRTPPTFLLKFSMLSQTQPKSYPPDKVTHALYQVPTISFQTAVSNPDSGVVLSAMTQNLFQSQQTVVGDDVYIRCEIA